MDDKLKKLQQTIGYSFNQVKLLVTALTHSSFANERQDVSEHNERLEFLGDAVLELCVSEELYTRFPKSSEGELTKKRARLVSEPSLAPLARQLELDRYVLLGKGEENQGGRQRDALLADVLEAVLGAVYLDGGLTAAHQCVLGIFENMWTVPSGSPKSRDYKSRLQEMTQGMFKERPVYSLVSTSGPEHAKTFTVEVTLPSGAVLSANGSSVKRAEQKAAHKAVKLLQEAEGK